MTKKTITIMAFLLATGFNFVFGQSDERNSGGLSVAMDMKLNLGEVTSREIGNSEVRPVLVSTKEYTWMKFGPEVTAWFTKDSYMKFGYEAENFGGYFRLNPLTIFQPQVNVWANIGHMFRVTAGNDIESLYADPLEADPDFRVYNGRSTVDSPWDAGVNTDNITHSEGLLCEGFFGPVTAALTGFVFGPNQPEFHKDTQNSENISISDTRQFRVGGRLGYEMGNWGKANVSYSLAYYRKGGQYTALNGELFPTTDATAETYTHYLGVFASLTPLENLGVTLGYGGVFTKYLDEFRVSASMVETVQPLVMQNALMLNARYTNLVPGLTLRTDHNYSFWMDKNLLSLAAIQGWGDRTYSSKSLWPNAADVSHELLWNGIGVGYRMTELIGMELYARNLYRRDHSLTTGGEEFTLERNELSVEPKIVFSLGLMTKLFVSVEIIHYTQSTSKDLNYAGANQFRGGRDNAVETKDTELKIRIPVGLTMQF